MLYSVVSQSEGELLTRKVLEIDPKAFINLIKTNNLNDRFYLVGEDSHLYRW